QDLLLDECGSAAEGEQALWRRTEMTLADVIQPVAGAIAGERSRDGEIVEEPMLRVVDGISVRHLASAVRHVVGVLAVPEVACPIVPDDRRALANGITFGLASSLRFVAAPCRCRKKGSASSSGEDRSQSAPHVAPSGLHEPALPSRAPARRPDRTIASPMARPSTAIPRSFR